MSAAAPYTLRFTEWRCGHHGQRPEDIPVHSTEQAQLILHAIACAISQPGHARAVVYDESFSTGEIYLTDDYVSPSTIAEATVQRTWVYCGTQDEIAQIQAMGDAYADYYGEALTVWDGTAHLDEYTEVVTTMSLEAINAATKPVEWYEGSERKAICTAPPALKPAADLLSELREHAAYLAEIAAEKAEEHGGAA